MIRNLWDCNSHWCERGHEGWKMSCIGWIACLVDPEFSCFGRSLRAEWSGTRRSANSNARIKPDVQFEYVQRHIWWLCDETKDKTLQQELQEQQRPVMLIKIHRIEIECLVCANITGTGQARKLALRARLARSLSLNSILGTWVIRSSRSHLCAQSSKTDLNWIELHDVFWKLSGTWQLHSEADGVWSRLLCDRTEAKILSLRSVEWLRTPHAQCLLMILTCDTE